MVVKLATSVRSFSNTFESSVNSYGGKTSLGCDIDSCQFESSVNSYGGKTNRRKKQQSIRV